MKHMKKKQVERAKGKARRKRKQKSTIQILL
jgi:hypothetical protein